MKFSVLGFLFRMWLAGLAGYGIAKGYTSHGDSLQYTSIVVISLFILFISIGVSSYQKRKNAER